MRPDDARIRNYFVSLLLALTCALPTGADAKQLFVDSLNGNDSVTYIDNTEINPWMTLGRATWGSTNQQSPSPTQAAQAGDTVIVRAGIYSAPGTDNRYDSAYNSVNSGSEGNYITFQTEGRVELRLSTGRGPVIGAVNKSYIIWDGFYIDETYAAPHPDTGPITVVGSNHITIRNSEVKGITVSYLDNHNAIRIDNSNDILIENNKLHGIRRSDTSHNAAAVMLYGGRNVLIQHNEIYDSLAAIFPKGSNNQNTIIKYNLLYGNRKGIRTSYSDTSGEVYQNIIRDCEQGGVGINIAEGTQNFIFANNTIDNCESGLGISTTDLWIANHFVNNIISNSASPVTISDLLSVPTQLTMSGNVYYLFSNFGGPNYSNLSFTAWQLATNQDLNSSTSNPMYANMTGNNFRLSTQSPARSIGIDLLDLDRDGSRSDVIPAGAYITGIEVIGITGGTTNTQAPSAPTGLRVQ